MSATPPIAGGHTADIDFELCGYKFKFGPSVRDGDSPFAPKIHGFSVWKWNGYYWGIEIADAHDLEGSKNSLQYKIAFDRQDRETQEAKARAGK